MLELMELPSQIHGSDMGNAVMHEALPRRKASRPNIRLANEGYEDMLADAERYRACARVDFGPPWRSRLYGRIGGWLIAVGRYLQSLAGNRPIASPTPSAGH